MPNIATPPSTVDGIKRLAKTIKRERDIQHTDSLNQAARLAGFENYRHAQRAIANASSSSPRHGIYLTAYWRERSRETRGAGRETLEIALPRALPAVVSRHQLERARNLRGFRMEYADHLEMRPNSESQALARKFVHAAARTLRFMVATSLQPATTQPQFSAMRRVDDLPLRDHLSHWIDPSTGDWLVLDEPYDHVTAHSAERDQWVRAQGLHIATPAWEGLYNPGHCLPFFISPNTDLLQRVVAAVQVMPEAPANWTGESATYFSDFISPEREASGKSRKRRPDASYGERMGAIPYGGAPGYPSRWRPAKPMTIESHMTVGPLLHGLCNSTMPHRAAKKLNQMRSELEDWALAEHGKAITQPMFLRMYYGEHVEPFKTPETRLDAIDRVRAALMIGYGECKPRRDMIAALDLVAAAISTSAGTANSRRIAMK